MFPLDGGEEQGRRQIKRENRNVTPVLYSSMRLAYETEIGQDPGRSISSRTSPSSNVESR
jgi:hypothetical protein